MSPGPEVTATASTSAARHPGVGQRPVHRRHHRLQVRPRGDLRAPRRRTARARPSRWPARRRAGCARARARCRSRRRRSRSPSTSGSVSHGASARRAHPLALHHDGVGAAGLVVAAPPADLGEPAPRGRAAGRRSLSARTSSSTDGAAPVGLGEQGVEQQRADPLALQRRGHAERGDVRLVVVGDQPGVADHHRPRLGRRRPRPRGGTRRPGSSGCRRGTARRGTSPPSRCRARRAPPPAPSPRAGRRRVIGRSRTRHAVRHRLDRGRAGWRRAGAGTAAPAAPADDGSASCGAAARSSPAVVTSAASTGAPSRSANAGSPTNGPGRPQLLGPDDAGPVGAARRRRRRPPSRPPCGGRR